jgi:hypothetical protein
MLAKRLRLVLTLSLAALFPISRIEAQTTTAQVSGRITDATGAVIAQASVKVTNTETGAVRTTETNGSGNYTLSLLPPGHYSLSVARSGFSTVTENDIVLNVDQDLSLDVPLSAGSVSETVTVRGNSELLQSSNSELGTVINEKTVHDLPLNGRNFTQLLTLTPGATPVSTSQGANQGTDDGSTVTLPGSAFSNPSINGQQNRSTLYLLDGVINTDFRTTTYTVLPIIDAINEFKVVSHADDPQYGSVLGGIINLVSKSGTNSVHGSAWEFVRNNIFDARNSFSDADRSSPQPFHQNEFGGTFGGPIWIPKLYDGRNKTFFFFAYEGWRYTQPTGSIYNSPTNAELNGDFSNSIYQGSPGVPATIFDPATTTLTGSSTYTRSQFAYNGIANVINPARINPQIQTYLETYLDRPNLVGVAGGNTVVTASEVNNANDFHGRLDQKLTGQDSVFFRWSTMGVIVADPTSNNITDDTTFNGINIGAGLTHVFSPKLLLTVVGGRASRPFTFINVSSKGSSGLAGFTTLGAYGAPAVGFDQFYAGTTLEGAQLRRNSSGSMSSNLDWQIGNHNVTVGGGFILQFRTQLSSDQSYNFDISQTGDPQAGSTTAVQSGTGNPVASALLGLPTDGQFQDNDGYKDSILSWFGFASDSWKVTPRLTINLGLRYDHLDQPDLKSGLNSGFDFATGNYLIGGGKLPPSCATAGVAPCIPGPSTDATTDLAGVLGNDGSVAGSHIIIDPNPIRGPNPVWTNLGPRIGFAYKLNSNMVAHGGFGIVYDDLSGISQTFSNSINNWPSIGDNNPFYNATFAAAPTTVVQSQANITGGLPGSTPFNQGGYFFDPNFKIPYSQQFNLGADQTFQQNYLLSINYVGAISQKLDYGGVANNAVVPGQLSTIPYPYMTHFVWDQSTANSNYNALQVKFERRMTNGFQFLVSYTYSKSIDDSSGRFGGENGAGGGSAIQDFYNPVSNRAVSGYDIPQFLSVEGLYELPVGRGKEFLNQGLLAEALGGWQLNTVTQLRSGQPYTIQVSGDIASIGDTVDTYGRPNAVAGVNPTPSHPTKSEWFNPAAFSTPIVGYGNVGRDSLRSANVYDTDFALLKNFAFDKVSLQFRAEAFNVFNIINYAAPNSNISQSNAGTVTSTELPSRQLQIALKLNF